MATKPEFLVAKGKMLVALMTVSVAISSPANIIIVHLNKQIYLSVAQQTGLVAAKTTGGPRDTHALCTQ